MKCFILFLIAIVLISGSISFGQEKTKVLNKNSIKISSIEMMPSNTVQENTLFIVKMAVSNEGQNEVTMLVDFDSSSRNANFDGDYILIDYCDALYTIERFNIMPSHSCIEAKGCKIIIKPKEQILFEWTVRAPSKEEIMVNEHRCTFKFNANYLSETYTIDYIYFATPYFISQKILGDEKVSVTKSNIATYGPVSVNMFSNIKDQFLSNRETWDLNVKVENHDIGIVQIRDMEILLPSSDIQMKEGCDGDVFAYKGRSIVLRDDTTKAKQARQIYDKSSNTLICELSAPQDVLFLKLYKFVTRLSYHYIVQKEKQVTVKTAV